MSGVRVTACFTSVLSLPLFPSDGGGILEHISVYSISACPVWGNRMWAFCKTIAFHI